MNIHEARNLFPVTENQLYFNHAACSPFSLRVEKVLQQYLKKRVKTVVDDYKGNMEVAAQVRSLIGQLINAPDDRIALTTNTTHGLNILATGLEWHHGDEILLSEMEFPANVYPFKNLERLGVKLRWVPSNHSRITVEDVEAAMTEKTRVLTLSFVQYLNGFRADLEEIGDFCRSQDILFIVDGIQGVGAFSMDVRSWHIDALAGGGHKWLMSPKGTGYLYLSEGMQNRLNMQYMGWLSVESPFEFRNFNQELKPSAKRFELATANAMGIAGMHAALRLLLDVGIDQISEHLLDLNEYLQGRLGDFGCEIFSNFDRNERSGIVLFSLGSKQENKRVFQKLLDEKVTISQREGSLRISPHFYNTKDDLDKFFDILQRVR